MIEQETWPSVYAFRPIPCMIVFNRRDCVSNDPGSGGAAGYFSGTVAWQ